MLLDLGAPARPARHDQRRRQPALSRRLRRLPRAPRAPARDRPARRLARRGRRGRRQGRAQPGAARRATSPTAASGRTSSRPRRASSSTPTRPISTTRSRDGLHRQGRADHAPALQRAAAEASGSRPRATAGCSRPSASASASAPTSTRCRSGTRRSRNRRRAPASRCTRSRSGRWRCTIPGARMNAWLRQIHGSNRLYLNRARAEALGLDDDDWVWVTSRHGRIKAQIRLMEGVNPDTCWTWNAIGKRAGAWNLAAERARGDAGLSAQPPDRRAAARAGERLPLRQRRPGDRPGGLVRPARADRARGGRRGRHQRAAARACCARRRASPRRRRSRATAPSSARRGTSGHDQPAADRAARSASAS